MQWKALRPGEIFEGRYRINSVLGAGGFAHVYRATQMDLGREVALKVLRPMQGPQVEDAAGQGRAHSTWVDRFRREAKVISKLRDPHTITMYDFGHTAEGMSYMVFEYISGQPLDEVLREGGDRPPSEVVEILRQSLESIQEAHSMGILHRDLKPANIMVYEHMGRANRVKVLDFGIAKPMLEGDDLTSVDLTRTGMLLGTPRYMSPEQLKGEAMGPPSDIYSLGLVAYELLSGTKAIGGNSTMQIITKQLGTDPIELPEDLEVPGGLRKVIHGMVTREAQDRFQSAREVIDALEGWAEEVDEAAAIEPTVAIGIGQGMGPQTTAPVAEEREGGGRRRGLMAALMIFVVLAAFVGFWIVGGDPDEAAMDTVAEVVEPAPESVKESAELAPDSEQMQVEELWSMTVVTEPKGAMVEINGKEVGLSPAQFGGEAFQFPLSVAARLEDGREVEAWVDAPGEERLELFFGEVEQKEEVDEPFPRPERQPRVFQPRRSVTPKVEPEPAAVAAPTATPTPRTRPAPQPDPEPDPVAPSQIFIPLD